MSRSLYYSLNMTCPILCCSCGQDSSVARIAMEAFSAWDISAQASIAEAWFDMSCGTWQPQATAGQQQSPSLPSLGRFLQPAKSADKAALRRRQVPGAKRQQLPLPLADHPLSRPSSQETPTLGGRHPAWPPYPLPLPLVRGPACTKVPVSSSPPPFSRPFPLPKINQARTGGCPPRLG